MLADTSLSGPTRDTVIDVFMRELQTLAPHGRVLIFDDFHLVDDAPDVQLIVPRLVELRPNDSDRLRHADRPGIPIASFARPARSPTDDATTSASMPTISRASSASRTIPEVSKPMSSPTLPPRTEGWAASLQLVYVAFAPDPGRDPEASWNLSGADQELYDYLAEEVVGDLPADLSAVPDAHLDLQVVRPSWPRS